MATHPTAGITRGQRAQGLRGIYVILNDGPQTLELARAVLDAGVTIVQYRAKRGIDAARIGALRALTRDSGTLLIVNDDWRAVERFDCDGVHLGPGDPGFDSPAPLRAALGDRLIGLSCGTLDEVRAANQQDVDYLGVGSVYATSSKGDAGEPIGVARLAEMVRASSRPVAAIGGINATNLPEVVRSGAAMAAILSAVSAAPDARCAAAALVDAWNP